MAYQHPHTQPDDGAFEVISIKSNKTFCEGGGGPLGHPRVYLSILQDERSVTCPYCSRVFVREA